MAEIKPEHPAREQRRNFLLGILGFVFFGLFLGTLNVVTRYLIPPARAKKSKKLTIDVAQIPHSSGLVLEYRGAPIILIHLESGVRAFSAECTHLGCIVKWHAEENAFLCPCHAGKFDSSGRVIAGPPPEPLPRIKIKIEKDKIILV